MLLCFVLFLSCKNNRYEEFSQEFSTITISCNSANLQEFHSASIRGQQDVDIYPQISGTISQVCVYEGENVKKGDILFVIDQIPYKAALQTAIANVHAAQARMETAKLDFESKKVLFKENVISEYDLSTAQNTLLVAQAEVEQAKAQELNARNNLSYTEIKSPSNGVVGTIPYRAGSLVSPSMANSLTTISDNNLMYVYFSMTENQLRSLVRQYGSVDLALKQMPPISLQLNDGSIYELKGRIETISGIINQQTGTVSIRAVFPNEKKMLWSGGIGNVVIAKTLSNVVVIPQTATYELQDKIFVYKVINGKAISTPILVESINDGNNYVVKSGLNFGDVIVKEGVGIIQDGMEICVK